MVHSNDFDCDVAIIGGGPSGSTAATVLARNGLRATVFEREKFPRFHIGESLLPFGRDLLRELGLEDKVDSFGWLRKYGAVFTTNEGEIEQRFDFPEYFGTCHEHAWEVDRATFDDLLLRHAQDQGADIREEHHIRNVDLSDEGSTLTVVGPDGKEFPWRARWVIDASGQASFLAKRLGLRETIPDLRKVALYSHYRGAKRREGRDEGHITLVFGHHCWFWAIPLSDDTLSIGCVTDRDNWSGGTPEEFLDSRIESCPYLRGVLADAERTRKVHTASAFSFQATQYVGPGWMLAGDSAAFLDPIFSTGVQIAMESAALAANQLATRLKAGGPLRAEMFRGYERRVRGWTKTAFRMIRAFYHPKFQVLFFNPRRRPVRHMAPFFAGQFDLSLTSRFYLRLFYFLLKVLEHRAIVEDPRPKEACVHHA
ncbi:MAG: tryptophan 7-halogenase [Planctomycetes bacterium]|nr:tryptophan 7-halogenase [Planctomycetota bacterium]